MLSSYFFHKWALDSDRRAREREMDRRQHLVRIEELTIPKAGSRASTFTKLCGCVTRPKLNC